MILRSIGSALLLALVGSGCHEGSVLETMSEAEAISAGHDGKLGACDDVANPIATPDEWLVH